MHIQPLEIKNALMTAKNNVFYRGTLGSSLSCVAEAQHGESDGQPYKK